MRFRIILATLALLLGSPVLAAEFLVLLDVTRLDPAVASRGPGPDGRPIRPRAVAAACVRDGILGPAAFSPQQDRCRAAAAVPGLRDLVQDLTLPDSQVSQNVLELILAGGVAVVLPSRRLACEPGRCDRDLFEGITYPVGLVGRPQPDPLPVPTIQQFSVQPSALIAGEPATLSWSAESVSECLLTASNNQSSLFVSASGQLSVSPEVDAAWTLTCAGPGGTDSGQVVATVSPPPGAPEIVLFAAARDDVPAGARTALIWDSRLVDACAIDDGSGPVQVPLRGQRRVTVNDTTSFRLICQNAVRSVSSSVDVRATSADQAPTIEFFEADRPAIERGDNVFVRWRAPDATLCRLRNGQDPTVWILAREGRFKLAPEVSTIFGLECRNAFGFDRSDLTVAVTESDSPLRILTFELSDLNGQPRGMPGPAQLRLPEPGLVRATWTTAGARACRLGDDRGNVIDVPTEGSRIVRVDATTALQINCYGSAAEAQSFGQVEVVGDLIFLDDFQR
jgi:hypothetical protein